MPEMKLTERLIRELEPSGDKSYERYWDTEVIGLCVKVLRSGKKKYEFCDRVKRKLTWAKKTPRCSEVSLADMRSQALRWKADMRRGIDPWKAESGRELETVSSLCLKNIESKEKQGLSERHIEDMKASQKVIASSFLGGMNAEDVGVRDANRFLLRFHGRERHHDRVRWFLLNSWVFGVKGGHLPLEAANPWSYIDKRYKLPDPTALPRFTDDEIEKMAYYLRKAEAGELKRNYNLIWIKFMWFLIRNGTRPDETRRIERKWIKPVGQGQIVDHPSTKTGRKIIHLSPASIQDIKETPRGPSGDWLFPGQVSHLVNYAKPYGAFSKEAGLDKPPYAIRRWYANTGRRVYEGDITPIKDLVGWESEAMALRYAGDDEQLSEKMIMENADVCRQVASRVDEIVGDR